MIFGFGQVDRRHETFQRENLKTWLETKPLYRNIRKRFLSTKQFNLHFSQIWNCLQLEVPA